MSKREEDFIEAAYNNDRESSKQEQQFFVEGCEYGYKYAIEHSDDVIRLIVKMAKNDIAFIEEEAVKFYHEEMIEL